MKEPQNQTHLFNQVWNERPHVSEVSREPLLPKGHAQWHWQFQHILPKGLYGKFKLRKDNIILLTAIEHYNVTNMEYLVKDDPKWKVYYERKEKLKQEYHGS